MRRRFLEYQGRRIHLAERSGVGPPMVLVHGLGGSTANWELVTSSLARRFRVMALDLPGFGLSPPARDYRLTTHRDTVVHTVEATVGEPVILVGNSMGGLVSMMVSDQRPDLVRALVLVAPATPPRRRRLDGDRNAQGRLALQALPLVGPIVVHRYLARRTVEQQVRETLAFVAARPGTIPPEHIERAVAAARLRRSQPWAVEALVRSGRDTARAFFHHRRFWEMVDRLTSDVLLVYGSQDRVVTVERLRRLAARRPDWSVTELEGIGHVPMIESPATFTHLLTDWTNRLLTATRDGGVGSPP